MENFSQNKKETFVPDEKREDFEEAVEDGRINMEGSAAEAEASEEEKKVAKTAAVGSIGLGALGAAVGLTGNPVGALIGGAAIGLAIKARASEKNAASHSRGAERLKKMGEDDYTTSRSIVEEGVAQTPPGEVIKIAREEMDADLQARKESEEEGKE